MKREYEDLLKVIGDESSEDESFCSMRYTDWENNIANPLLEKQGFEILNWCMGEVDSFGPLSRYVVCKKDGEVSRFIYG